MKQLLIGLVLGLLLATAAQVAADGWYIDEDGAIVWRRESSTGGAWHHGGRDGPRFESTMPQARPPSDPC